MSERDVRSGSQKSKSNGNPAVVRAEVAPTRRIIEIAPGQRLIPVPKQDIPTEAIAFVRWQDCGDGTHRPVYKIVEREIRVTEAARILGMPYMVLLRLIRAGFIKGLQITPGNWQMDLISYFSHTETVRSDPEFWQRDKNRRAYRDAL